MTAKAFVRSTALKLACVAALATTVTACIGGGGSADRGSPDEFRVVTKAPLVIPPEYNLRPPKPGEARPQERTASESAQLALYRSISENASDAEQLLLAKTGAAASDLGVRNQVDIEAAGVVRKTTGFANRILFWRDGDTAAEGADAFVTEEELRAREALAQATIGDGEVKITKGGGRKLPGL